MVVDCCLDNQRRQMVTVGCLLGLVKAIGSLVKSKVVNDQS